ncbi:hypothetical protein WG68_13980 [Arsukibacterium ikkense]|uniref:HTH araC/xylS-type domain-containing protein n=1 Tax=Arsukibacterium ikkense TaxID=336831 RepID=A0A0M2V4V2_9GAMM|nr:AraC family transcriptional regulator [Arsukibacterium ikkense]KKO44660.1 hypothetical protein WG68_13980 [Arsukibacterium ikkense]
MYKTPQLNRRWHGSAAITAGIGVFVGLSGDNTPHKHWAHQLVIGFYNDICVRSGDYSAHHKGVLIPAGVAHQLDPADVLCIYIDPLHIGCPGLLQDFASPKDRLSPLSDQLVEGCMTIFNGIGDLHVSVQRFCQIYGNLDQSQMHNRLQYILDTLKHDIACGMDTSRATLAKQVHLSPSRFSHWFSKQTGLPLRSYKKWLKLIVGFELSRTMSLTDAALAAGFSDQAHFCRAVKQGFGVSPATIKQLLSA